jgi:hypothetical protein
MASAGAAALAVSPIIDVEDGVMFGVHPGETGRQIRQTLGRPDAVETVPKLGIHWFYARYGLQMFLNPRTKRVEDLFTSDPNAKTASGLGLGSTEQQIVQGFPGSFCVNFGGPRHCSVGGRGDVTEFNIEAGHVASIEIWPASPLPVPLVPVVDVSNGAIFQLRSGNSEGQVRRILGRPDVTKKYRKSKTLEWYYYKRLNLSVQFDERTNGVVLLQTADSRAKTATGLGLGSSEAEIVSAYPGAVCSTAKGERSCDVGGRGAQTIFFERSGRTYLIQTSRL